MKEKTEIEREKWRIARIIAFVLSLYVCVSDVRAEKYCVNETITIETAKWHAIKEKKQQQPQPKKD